GGQRLLRGIFERRIVAPLAYCTHTSGVSPRRLAAVSKNQPAVRGRRAAGNGRHRIADTSRAGLSLRAAAANGEGRAARRASSDFLAYPLAERGSVRNLSVAARTRRWAPWRWPNRFPYSIALQQFAGSNGRRGRSAHGMGPFCGKPARAHHASADLSD